ncbi:hypothetical protein HRH59_11105 [Rheinheimera sp. YQF-2]|uniref:Uncharacterized protein n=1 Tax=Rheinheimera lutimaris TaxID=2740584 RepID=A0A7Y5ELD2_9GAMM|nr:hypothetical protein [Rheinheimera lutimaris]NRQ43093.1 hypothetical protein [Rheinheimera lutimaris]
MSVLGISDKTKNVYIGDSAIYGRPIVTNQLVIPISFPRLVSSVYRSLGEYPGLIFLEDIYEPAAGIKRGRVFCLPISNKDWMQSVFVRQVEWAGVAPAKVQEQYFYHYQIYNMHHYISDTKSNQAILGNGEYASFWKVIAVEQVFGSDVVVTLKSTRSNGVLPVLLSNDISAEDYQRLSITLDEVQTANRKISPFHLVESCRSAAACAVGIAISDPVPDLGKALSKLAALAPQNTISQYTGNIIARLHSRAKPNAQAQHGTRDLTEEDAQTALHSLSLLLVELGLAKY